MERFLPYNYDGSSCFMNSLLCALFYPNKLRVIDPYLLQGRRADMSHSYLQDLCLVLRTVAKCVRGSKVGDADTFTAVRPLLSHYLHHLDNVQFEYGQHDPADLYESLLRVYNIGGVFTTKKTIESEYNTGRKTISVTTDQMFRHSVFHSVTEGHTKFETLFPSIDTLVISPPSPMDPTSEVLVKKRTILEFSGGPVFVLTRETAASKREPVDYGRYSHATNAFVLPVLNTVERCVDWYELQAAVCWNGQVSTTSGAAGHYVCFVYDDTTYSWYFYNDLNRKFVSGGARQAFAGLELMSSPEAHSVYPPSVTGTMFIYVKLVEPPSDVQ